MNAFTTRKGTPSDKISTYALHIRRRERGSVGKTELVDATRVAPGLTHARKGLPVVQLHLRETRVFGRLPHEQIGREGIGLFSARARFK